VAPAQAWRRSKNLTIWARIKIAALDLELRGSGNLWAGGERAATSTPWAL